MTNRNPESSAGPPGYELPVLDVSVRSDGASALVVEVRGELDLLTGPILQQQLKPYNDLACNDGSPPQRIVYHLSELEFMDATGLAALLAATDGHGPDTITVREPSPLVRRVLEIVGLEAMIEEAYR